MSMNYTVPFEDGINAGSMIRRLKNVKRERRRTEKNSLNAHSETIDTVDPDNPKPSFRQGKRTKLPVQ